MNLAIKDVPSTLHRKLKAQAEANQRSLNGEVIYLLAQAAESKPVDVELVLVEIDNIHRRLKIPPLTG